MCAGDMNLGPVQSSKCFYHRTIAPAPNQPISKSFHSTRQVLLPLVSISSPFLPHPTLGALDPLCVYTFTVLCDSDTWSSLLYVSLYNCLISLSTVSLHSFMLWMKYCEAFPSCVGRQMTFNCTSMSHFVCCSPADVHLDLFISGLLHVARESMHNGLSPALNSFVSIPRGGTAGPRDDSA